MGGLRADVNVSVLPRNTQTGGHLHSGITELGQRTEVKNLSSLKAIEDAIMAERDRQIAILESGAHIESETRGWSLGGSATTRLRGKEGEIDYRYMSDPDLPPIMISEVRPQLSIYSRALICIKSMIKHIRNQLPILPDEQTRILVTDYGLTMKDAKALISLDSGSRVDYFFSIIDLLSKTLETKMAQASIGKAVSNWYDFPLFVLLRLIWNRVLHELGGLFGSSREPFDDHRISASNMSSIIENLTSKHISGRTAKDVLALIFGGDTRDVAEIIRQDNLTVHYFSDKEYHEIARNLIKLHPEMAGKVLQGDKGKLQWFVGQFVRQANGKVDAQKASSVLRSLLNT